MSWSEHDPVTNKYGGVVGRIVGRAETDGTGVLVGGGCRRRRGVPGHGEDQPDRLKATVSQHAPRTHP